MSCGAGAVSGIYTRMYSLSACGGSHYGVGRERTYN